ncbi:nuclear transport factor 2 family protein [Micromonospora sp. NBC_01796]|uniref:nuclear transport factor 2 family protein n=1 Tax=Micromonospora sp. NBC_01796 TaxID=2975987 RepID=UPI002DD9E740|nr:nuclear transport factor 2 family protein [Micromonospora sp. NBC_01796]WSA83509.1 nuclear transport factor 2 family protein [Micromonospora sp. NBC_01796]
MTTENKTIVQRALAGLIETGNVDTLASFLSDDFVHHRPDSTASTRAQWLTAVRAALGPTAGMQVEILHLLADGDHVVVHSRRRLPDSGPEIVVVDVMRIADGLIAEIWEIIEPVAHAAANLVWWESAPEVARDARGGDELAVPLS